MPVGIKQIKLLGIKDEKTHLISAIGAIRTGKTLFGSYGFAELMIHRVTTNNYGYVPGYNRFAIIGQANVESTHKNASNSVKYWLQLRGWMIQTHKFDFIAIKGKHKIFVETYAMANALSFKRLQGNTFRAIMIDEAPLISLESIETAQSRCISFDDYVVFMTGNPEGTTNHPFYTKYIDSNSEITKNKLITNYNFKLTDNPINGQDKIDYYKKLFTPTMFKRKVLGGWVQAEGACYRGSPEIWDGRFLTNDEEFIQISVGIDDGDNDATTAVAVGISNKARFYVLDQYYHKNNDELSKSPTTKSKDIARMLIRLWKQYNAPLQVRSETNPATQYLLLRDEISFPKDMEIEIYKVNKRSRLGKTRFKNSSSIQERIDVTNILLSYNMLYTVSKLFPLISAIDNAIYKNGERRDDGTSDIDSLDAFEYAISEYMLDIIEFVSDEELETQINFEDIMKN